MRLRLLLVLVGLAAAFAPSTVAAAPGAEGATASVQTNLDFVWMIVAAALIEGIALFAIVVSWLVD